MISEAPEKVTRSERPVRPFYNVEERANDYEVRVYMPGVSKQGTQISLENDELTVAGTRVDKLPEGWRTVSRETRDENYLLRLRLNVEIDGERIAAKTEDGVLRLSLPKAEAAKPRRIAIE